MASPVPPRLQVLDASLAAEPASLDTLFRQYYPSIRRYIERRFGMGPPDPEDAVQAAFERFARIGDKSAIDDPGAFLHRSARNFVLDHIRAQSVRVRHGNLERALADETDEIDAERVLSAKERMDVIERAIRAMDDRRRDVLIMHRIHGLNAAEIGRQLGCSATLVKMRLAEAVALCQRALRDADGEA